MNKEIHKGIMVRSRLINKFLKEKTAFTREAYNKQRNYCVKLIRESKITCLKTNKQKYIIMRRK